ncbi:hypothetical protein F4554_003900 [Actinopolymorpha rutila]|uniref:Nucleotidyltransferase domain-containing protein n=1 Tax=Actinopolymorpha rutila TaxID=446787 RepID=A0A852ZHZ1_9ACTN|nr:hypothetical protein [Actinopolymorpha rutila]
MYGSVAQGQADEWSDLDLLVVAGTGSRESLWAEREEWAGRILAGPVVLSGELSWQRPYRYAAYRADAVQLDLTIDEGHAEPWRGVADGFVTISDRDNLADRLRADLVDWKPRPAEADIKDGPTWVWLKYLAGRLRRGQFWMVRCGLASLSYERIVPLLGASPNAMETTLSEAVQRQLHEALPASDDPAELARGLRATTALYVQALDVWANRTGRSRPHHPMAPAVLSRIEQL